MRRSSKRNGVGRQNGTRKATFLRGFVDGLASVVLLSNSSRPRARKYHSRGIEGDWEAVGNSIRRAFSASW